MDEDKSKVAAFVEACDLVGIPNSAYVHLSVDVDWAKVERSVPLHELKSAIKHGNFA